jgi:hypothetical protein
VLDLYARTFDGIPLDDGEYVLFAIEKPGVQARHRIQPRLDRARHTDAFPNAVMVHTRPRILAVPDRNLLLC